MNMTRYITESLAELHHVRWPTRHQAVRLSIITIGFTVVAAASFGIIDYVLGVLVQFLLSLTY